MKNSADLGGCCPPRPSASVDNILLDLQNSSYPTQPHSIIANYYFDIDPFSTPIPKKENYPDKKWRLA